MDLIQSKCNNIIQQGTKDLEELKQDESGIQGMFQLCNTLAHAEEGYGMPEDMIHQAIQDY